jgi:hypothetical protein
MAILSQSLCPYELFISNTRVMVISGVFDKSAKGDCFLHALIFLKSLLLIFSGQLRAIES